MTMTLSGDGTITGLVAGGLPNATVTADDLAAGAALNSVSDGVFFRNRIINGDMRIDQRNAGASVTPTNGQYCPDRWRAELTQASKYSLQQVSDAPDGFNYSLKATSLSAYSVTSTDQFNIRQAIEGFNVADLMYGTANAKTTTVSFWVKSSLTGTFGASFANASNTRLYNFNYTIASADTWEYKTAVVPGDTTGTWQTTTSAGLFLRFNLGLGATYGSTTVGSWVGGIDLVGNPNATSVIGTLNATFYITGVQLEVGSVATPFERRPYGTELALCQRYYFKPSGNYLDYPAFRYGTRAYTTIPLPVTMRASPTVVDISSSTWYQVGTTYTYTPVTASGTVDRVSINGDVSGGLDGGAGTFYPNFTASAEL